MLVPIVHVYSNSDWNYKLQLPSPRVIPNYESEKDTDGT